MTSIKSYFWYLTTYNISIFISYLLIYYQNDTFETNFFSLGFNQFQLVLILNLLTSFIFYSASFLVKFETTIFHYLVSFSLTKFTLISFFWIIKFVNLSRAYILFNVLLFLIISVFLTRIFESNVDDTYISFEKELCDKNQNFYFTNYQKFPSDFLDLTSALLKDRNLKGLVFSVNKIENFNFKEIVEISNYFGINIYELKGENLS